MKINLHSIILTSIFAITGIYNSFGQENAELMPHEYRESSIAKESNNEEESISEEMLLKSQSGSFVVKDSIVYKGSSNTNHQKKGSLDLNSIPKSNENQKQEKSKDDKNSILSFNFLYYIFQKFKLSDIVDK